MNTILVPIDFSETSDNALNYAVNLANYLSMDIVLLHVNSIPVYNNEYNVVSYSITESIETSLDLLKEKATQLKKNKQLIGDVNYFTEAGDLKTIIGEYITKKNIDLIVMGITGHETKIGQILFGSNAVDVSKESITPVFIIPKNYHYKKIENIAYASEYDVNVKEQTGLVQMKSIIAMFNANLNVLHVIPEEHLINQTESETDVYVEEKLEKINHKTYILTEDKVSTALVDFIKAHDTDLIVIEQKDHSFLHKLFNSSATQEVAFNSPVPVLTIHS
jgi:nucleotide-binding universal stress UspA family protein